MLFILVTTFSLLVIHPASFSWLPSNFYGIVNIKKLLNRIRFCCWFNLFVFRILLTILYLCGDSLCTRYTSIYETFFSFLHRITGIVLWWFVGSGYWLNLFSLRKSNKKIDRIKIFLHGYSWLDKKQAAKTVIVRIHLFQCHKISQIPVLLDSVSP